MLITFLSWIIITVFAVNMGILIECLLKKIFNIEIDRPDKIIITGMMGLTIYAGLFSVAYKVGLLANVILLAISVAVLLTKKGRTRWQKLLSVLFQKNPDRKYIVQLVLAALILLAALFLGSTVETFYDTELYHAQAIRWIEEYGAVKGLGILHSRFSYNSCFLPLQALFGFRWLFGTELHSVNAYLAFVFSVWAAGSLSIWKERTLRPSDGLKFVLLIFTWTFELSSLSSPNTDYFALSMAVYILACGCESADRYLHGEKEKALDNKSLAGDFILYSFWAVYAISLKLSVALIVLIAVYPAVALIRRKEWKKILFAILTGIVIICPYLIRNVIISGYLVYPYTQIDLFDVYWKVTKSLADYDRKEIMVWGRSLKDTDMYDYTLSQWVPIWWSNVPHIWRRILEASFILTAAAFIKCVIYLFSRRKSAKGSMMLLIYIDSAAMLLMWFMSAPLLRYGAVFALLIPAIFIGDVTEKVPAAARKIIGILGAAAVALVCVGYTVYFFGSQELNLITPAPYQDIENREYDYDGLTIYYAEDGTDWVGYNDFPAIPYEPDRNCLGIMDVNDLSKGFWNAETNPDPRQ